MNQTEVIVGLIGALANFAWAFWAFAHIKKLESQLALSKMEDADDKAVAKNHALDDSGIDAELSKDLGSGAKP